MAPPSSKVPEQNQRFNWPRLRNMGGYVIWLLLTAVLLFVIFRGSDSASEDAPNELSYSTFLKAIDDGQIASVQIQPTGEVFGERSDGSEFHSRLPVSLAGETLLDRLEAASVEVEALDDSPSWVEGLIGLLFSLLPIVLLVGFFIYLSRRSGGAMAGSLKMGRAKAKVFDAERPTTTFDDVAGYEGVKAEVMEIADFIRDPDRYRRAGANAPRGVLMTGPPGTGKTLLARALAGEVGVPFLSVTGSSFVEMFVGVGAARVRDLFEEARKRAPVIVFVDEIDAIGQRRQGRAVVSNDEREQTLNQLLSEMDGFDPSVGIVVLAATNRPEVLDAALLRPGRFDRQVTIPLPNQEERLAILSVHCRGKRLSATIDLTEMARGTPGFSGADLANLVNEAAIRAAREDRQEITDGDVEDARDRILLGQRDRSTVLLPEERRAVASHEAGHALVAALCDNADPVHKVTILPSGRALGVTQQLPAHERHLYSEGYLYDTLAVQLAGRAAELLVFGQGSTGAADDLATATNIATKMVKEYGLSPELGPVGYPGNGSMFLTGDTAMSTRPYADQTQASIDSAVARILSEAQDRASRLLSANVAALSQLVEQLLLVETIDGEVVYEIAGRTQPAKRPQVLGPSAPGPELGRECEESSEPAIDDEAGRQPEVKSASARSIWQTGRR